LLASKASLMLIGCGRHATRSYLPVLSEVGVELRDIVIVDLETRLTQIRALLERRHECLAVRASYLGDR